jgi:hypothetical protein
MRYEELSIFAGICSRTLLYMLGEYIWKNEKSLELFLRIKNEKGAINEVGIRTEMLAEEKKSLKILDEKRTNSGFILEDSLW